MTPSALAALAHIRQQIAFRMESQSVSRADLARRLDVAPPQINQWLDNARANLTLQTLDRIADALDCELVVILRQRS